MPFLAPVVAGIGSVLSGVAAWATSSTILAGIAQTAFGIALKYAAAKIFQPKPKSTSTKLETEYGGNLSRFVGMGKYALKGHHIFRNANRKGNRFVQDVYVLSHFRITGLPRVQYRGQWVNLAGQPVDPNYGIQVAENVFVRFKTGTMAQTADATLVADSNPAGRWTTNHRGAGVAYAIVTTYLNAKTNLTSPASLIFEVQGAPLYDWRKDSTVGGFGAHRWNDQSTWEYSENPVVQMYNLERGIFNGTQKMVGKGTPAAKLPLSEWTTAANIADELDSTSGQIKYRSSLMATSSKDSDHSTNMEPLLEACSATWVETVTGSYLIAGAPQASAFTIVDGDLMRDQPKRVTMKRPRVELINTVVPEYPSPAAFYAVVPGAARVDTAALAEDGEELASNITYDAVIYSEQVDRLADIAIRAARYQGTCEITIHPRFLDFVKVGKWFTWNSTKYGNYTWQITSVFLLPLNTSTGARNIRITARQVANGIFDRTAYENEVIVTPPTGVPDYQAELAGFVVTPNWVTGSGGEKRPGAFLTWNVVEDTTVNEIEIQYWPVSDPTQIFTKIVKADHTVDQLSEGLTGATNWVVRTRLVTIPPRPVAWSTNFPFTTLAASYPTSPVDETKLADDLRGYIEWIGTSQRDIIRQIEEVGTHFADQELNNYAERREILVSLNARSNEIEANYKSEILVAAGPDSALARSITTLGATVNNPSTGVLATSTALSALQTRVTTAEGNISANALSINQIKSSLGSKAEATAVSSLETRVDTVGGVSSANALAITSLTSTINDVTADATFRMETSAAPSGWTARIGMQVRVGTSDTYKFAGIFLDTTTTLSRVAIIADQFIVTDNTNFKNPFIFTGGVATLNVANIGTVTAGVLQSPNGKMVINLNNGTIEIFS